MPITKITQAIIKSPISQTFSEKVLTFGNIVKASALINLNNSDASQHQIGAQHLICQLAEAREAAVARQHSKQASKTAS